MVNRQGPHPKSVIHYILALNKTKPQSFKYKIVNDRVISGSPHPKTKIANRAFRTAASDNLWLTKIMDSEIFIKHFLGDDHCRMTHHMQHTARECWLTVGAKCKLRVYCEPAITGK